MRKLIVLAAIIGAGVVGTASAGVRPACTYPPSGFCKCPPPGDCYPYP